MPQSLLQTVTCLRQLCLLVPLLICQTIQAGDLLIEVEGKQDQANLYLALVLADQQDWQPSLRELQGTETPLLITGLPPGRYAVQVFQDSNDNGQLDLSPRGIPLEPVGFSGNPSLFGGKPKPSDSLFEHGTADSVISVRLIPPRKKKERLAPVAPRAGDR
ncbi:DUF2141 domain-containing protein [Ectopseudomonas chengduensis]|nr:DUF2141 domain-containing protein [Pseudomonas chengduensis]UZT78998.1 DUF2141 domain-containing protein [Pseudomonas chengduensis]